MNKINISFYNNYVNTSEFNFENYYDISDFYEVETFRAWEETFEKLKIINKLFIIGSLILAVIDFLLLSLVLSARVRKESASWYLFHLNFVTILQVSFSLPRLEASLHATFGTCMFFAFTEWVLTLAYYVNIVLMDLEILANIFASDALWKSNPKKRFHMSMAIMWILCILFSAIVMFFSRDEHSEIPICFNLNKTAEVVGHITKNLLPFIFTTSLMIAGVTLFIRSKRTPESFSHVTRDKLQAFNEWFTCFMAWNFFIAFAEILASYMHTYAITMGFLWDVVFQMAIFIIHVSLPITCLLLEPVRTTCGEWAMAVFQYTSVIKRSCLAYSPDIQLLRVDTSE